MVETWQSRPLEALYRDGHRDAVTGRRYPDTGTEQPQHAKARLGQPGAILAVDLRILC